MTGPWIAAFAALSALVMLLTVLMIGVLTRALNTMRRLEIALVPHDSFERGEGPQIGTVVPTIPATDQSASVDTTDGLRWSVVVFVEAGCEPCQVLTRDLGRHPHWNEDVRGILVVDDPGLVRADEVPDWTLHVDLARTTAVSWSVSGTPSAFLVDKDGILRASGHPNSLGDLKRLLRSRISASTIGTNPKPVAPEQRSNHVH